MNIKYRKSKEEDMSFILEILHSVSGDVKDINSEQFLIAEDNNKIVGCVRVREMNDYFKLASLAVVLHYRRMGIGSTLVAMIANEYIKRPLYLFCNKREESFYGKLGFKRIEAISMPECLKKDYENLLNLKFAGHIKLLVIMCLV